MIFINSCEYMCDIINILYRILLSKNFTLNFTYFGERGMKSYKKIILFGILFVSFAITISLNVNTAVASQSGIYVSPTGHDTWNGQNPTWNGKDGPEKTIKNAVGIVSSGGTVKIAGGTYYEHGIIISKSMNINGESRKNTIINAQYLGNIFTVRSG